MFTILYLALGLIAGGAAAFFYLRQESGQSLLRRDKELSAIKEKIFDAQKELNAKQNEVKDKEREASSKAHNIIQEAKTQAKEIKIDLEKDQARIEQKEQLLEKQEKNLDDKFEQLDKQRERLDERQQELSAEKEKYQKANAEQVEALEKIAKLSKDEAEKQLLSKVEDQSKDILLKQIHKAENDLKEDAKKTAQKVICQAIQKYASEVASEKMTTIVEIPSDDMKGRIIGREGRNINAIEAATGVDVIIDDTPNAIMISGFDLARRFVAKSVIEKLVEDGRIQPARIEEITAKKRSEANEMMKDLAEKALMEMNITNLHPELVQIVGRLHFRSSYGQNQLKHAMEVGYICMNMANELGMDPEKAKMAGFFHDIGKGVDHQVEGGHALISAEILRKYGIDKDVVEAVESHHEDVPIQTALGFLVCAADAISGARPGARRESNETYIKRLKGIETAANSFDGVKQSFAVQAGRVVRVMVEPEKMDDYACKKLAMNIAKKIEKDVSYPGQIKVLVIRETRTAEYAK